MPGCKGLWALIMPPCSVLRGSTVWEDCRWEEACPSVLWWEKGAHERGEEMRGTRRPASTTAVLLGRTGGKSIQKPRIEKLILSTFSMPWGFVESSQHLQRRHPSLRNYGGKGEHMGTISVPKCPTEKRGDVFMVCFPSSGPSSLLSSHTFIYNGVAQLLGVF